MPSRSIKLISSIIAYRSWFTNIIFCREPAIQRSYFWTDPVPGFLSSAYLISKVAHSVCSASDAPSPVIPTWPAVHRWSSLCLQFTASQSIFRLFSGVLNRFLNIPPSFSEKLPQQVSQHSFALHPSTTIASLQQQLSELWTQFFTLHSSFVMNIPSWYALYWGQKFFYPSDTRIEYP